MIGEFCQIDCNAVVGMGTEVPRSTKVNSCTAFNKIDMAKEIVKENFF